MSNDANRIYRLLGNLKKANIFYTISHNRENVVTVEVAVPGQRWEIDLLEDGTTEVEIFSSDGSIYDESKLIELFRDFSD